MTLKSIQAAIRRALAPVEDDYSRFCRERAAKPRKRCLNEAAHKLER